MPLGVVVEYKVVVERAVEAEVVGIDTDTAVAVEVGRIEVAAVLKLLLMTNQKPNQSQSVMHILNNLVFILYFLSYVGIDTLHLHYSLCLCQRGGLR